MVGDYPPDTQYQCASYCRTQLPLGSPLVRPTFLRLSRRTNAVGSFSLVAFCSKRWLATRDIIWLLRQLTCMPDADDPDRVTDHPIEEAVRRDGKLAVRELWELRYLMTGVWVLANLCDDCPSVPLDARRSCGILGTEVAQRSEILPLRLTGEMHLHEGYSSASSPRASAITSSASRPSPAAISASPRARIRRISFSCCVRS
jgi:hypothetical protein